MIVDTPAAIDAVHGQRLEAWSQEAHDADSTALAGVCAEVRTATDQLIERLRLLAPTARFGDTGQGQRISVGVEVDAHVEAAQLVDRLRVDGWDVWQAQTGAAEACRVRVESATTLTRSGDAPAVVEVSWPASSLARVPGALRPTTADYAMADLPDIAWPAYFAVRPLRLALERLGRRPPVEGRRLGPFLATPDELVPELAAFAGITADDHVVDLGCGDGGVLRTLARTIGCRTTGIEIDGRLVERGRQRAAEEGLDHLVELQVGDVASANVRADVAFLFVPAESLATLLPSVLADVGRVVAHEQAPIPGAPADRSAVVAAGASVTVAHRWGG